MSAKADSHGKLNLETHDPDEVDRGTNKSDLTPHMLRGPLLAPRAKVASEFPSKIMLLFPCCGDRVGEPGKVLSGWFLGEGGEYDGEGLHVWVDP